MGASYRGSPMSKKPKKKKSLPPKSASGLGSIQSFDIAELLANVERVQKELVESQQYLRDRTVEGSAGGGMVRISLKGDHRVAGVKISPQCLDPEDIEVLEDLIAAAINDALAKLESLAATEAQGTLSQLGPIPGLDEFLGQSLMSGPDPTSSLNSSSSPDRGPRSHHLGADESDHNA
ncbi:MAG: hypothetical protein C4318_06930 [Acidimicrobiia bacterium]